MSLFFVTGIYKEVVMLGSTTILFIIFLGAVVIRLSEFIAGIFCKLKGHKPVSCVREISGLPVCITICKRCGKELD